MDYNQSDSSGTDDDLPPSHSGRVMRGGRISGNGRGPTGRAYGRPQAPGFQDLIYKLEQDAYTAVLRAFGAQSEAITWDKERLMTDLRKELRISDEQHREFLGRVAADDTIRQIQSWRKAGDESRGLAMNAPPPDPSPSPAVSQSRKRHKSAQPLQSAFPPPPPAPLLLPAPVPSSGPAATPRRGVPVGHRGRKSNGARQPPTVTVPNIPTVGGPSTSRSSNLGKVSAPEGAKAVGASDLLIDSWIGRRVKTRWPEDNTFYEAVVSDYNPDTGMHALVYDMNTDKETWEWVNLMEMMPSDLKFVEGPLVSVGGKVPPTRSPPAGRGAGGRGSKRSGGARGGLAPVTGRARGSLKLQNASAEKVTAPNPPTKPWKNSTGTENGVDRKGLHTAELPPLEDLMKEVDKLEEEEDLAKLESAKRIAKDHEEAIRKALAEVGESSDEAESDDGGHLPSSHTQSMDHGRGNNRLDARDHHPVSDDENNTAGDDRGEGSDGEPMVGEGGGVSEADDEHQHEGDEKDEDE